MSSPSDAVLSALADAEATWKIADAAGFEPSVPTSEDERTLLNASLGLLRPEQLESSALLWISPDMVDLTLHAARTLPPYDFQPSVLPWPNAFVVAAKPLYALPHPEHGEVATEAVQWAMVKDDACFINGLARVHGPHLLSPMSLVTLKSGGSWKKLNFTSCLSYGDIDTTPEQNDRVGRVLCTLWLLLQQKVAVKRRVTHPRPDRRRWERHSDRPVPDVTVVELRRPINTTPHEDSPGVEVDWSHRWIVDGHWRNQYHPSTGEHVPTWIAPYVKGPEDKPLVVKRKVNAWVR